MFVGYAASINIEESLMSYPAIFAFGLIAFGMLGMGPVTIAVDSYGPVTDNAQSVYELSLIEVKCSLGAREDLGRPTTTALENKQNFMRYLKTL